MHIVSGCWILLSLQKQILTIDIGLFVLPTITASIIILLYTSENTAENATSRVCGFLVLFSSTVEGSWKQPTWYVLMTCVCMQSRTLLSCCNSYVAGCYVYYYSNKCGHSK